MKMTPGLLGLSLVGKWGGGFSPLAETAALVARFTTPPSDERLVLIDTLIGSLIDAGVWAKLDALYVLAAADAQAAQRNWIADEFNLAVSGTPTFTADQGYAGHPASSARLVGTSFSPSLATQNAMTAGIYTRTASSFDGSTAHMDLFLGTCRMQRHATIEANYSVRVNDGSNYVNAVAAQTGHFSIRRTASNERSLWHEGEQVATNSQASTGNMSSFELLAANNTLHSDSQLSLAYAGGVFTDQQMADMNSAIETYLAF